MHAIAVGADKTPDSLHIAEVPDPSIAPGNVRIEVHAAGVNRADLLQRQGHYPPPPGASSIIGLECSGVIREVGEGVDRWTLGDEVCALLSGGGYAEQVVVPSAQVFPVPSGVDLVTAGGIPEAACTVWSNLRRAARLQAGQVFLMHGGASGIGTIAIQVGRHLGARVAVTAGSADKLARCAELGAEILINYREQDFVEQIRAETRGAGADVILDIIGAKYLKSNISALAPDGDLVVIGLQGGIKAELNLGALLAKRGSLHATALRTRPATQKAEICAEVTEHLWPAYAAGQIVPVVDRVLPWREAASAHQLLAESEHVGKVILQMR